KVDLEIAITGNHDFCRVVNLKDNASSLGAGRNYEVMLQVLAIAVVHQVNAGIDGLVAKAAIIIHMGPPIVSIRPDQIVAVTREFILCAQLSGRRRAHKTKIHPRHALAIPWNGESCTSLREIGFQTIVTRNIGTARLTGYWLKNQLSFFKP